MFKKHGTSHQRSYNIVNMIRENKLASSEVPMTAVKEKNTRQQKQRNNFVCT